jgi:hypothetical protein
MALTRVSDCEFAMSEFGDLEEGVLGILCVLSISVGCCLVVVCGSAMVVRCAHVHVTGVFTGSASICCGHSPGPALAVTRGCSVHVLQGFVFDVGIGVGRKGPDFADLFVHVSGWGAAVWLRFQVGADQAVGGQGCFQFER